MSDISTSTPSGDGNRNLYETNPDTGRIETNFPENFIEFLGDREIGNNEGDTSAGTASSTGASKGTRVSSGEIKEVGCVGIQVVTPPTKEEYDAAKKAIKARAARSATTRDTANPEIENEGK